MVEDPLLMWSPQPNFQGTFFDSPVRINSLGFRDQEYALNKDKNTFRVVVLGDSTTFGLGVNSIAKTYHTLLEEKLNNDFDGTMNYEVINGGVTGYTSYQGLQVYKHKLSRFEPDVVLFYFGINDPIRRFYLDDKQVLGRSDFGSHHSRLKNILGASSFFKAVMPKIISDTKARYSKNIPRVSLVDYQNNIVELNKLCESKDTMLILISPPLNNRASDERKREINDYRNVLESTAIQNGIPLLTPTKLTENGISNENYFRDSVHLNERGHKVLMERIFDYLISSRVIGQSK